MPKKTTTTEPKAPRAPKTFAPEIVEARNKCHALREAAELECKKIMTLARQAAIVRKLTDAMTPEQKEVLRKSLEAKRVIPNA